MTDTEQDIHDGIMDAVETADISKIRKSLIKCLRLDACRKFYFLNQNVSEIRFETLNPLNKYEFFNGELDYASGNAADLLDEHDGEKFLPIYRWNYGYVKTQLGRLTKNFSMPRIELVKKMLLAMVFLNELKMFILFLIAFSFGSWIYSLYKHLDFSLFTALTSALGAWCLWIIISADEARKKK
ncbi:hypothetical protein [Ruminobacter sp.]|uniref:hypothetical protein n=1 Tax=Ruminobacter sp. TaxID=2774296 RepID=UPI0038681B44